MIWLIAFLSIGNGISKIFYLHQDFLSTSEKKETLFLIFFYLLSGILIISALKFIKSSKKLNLKIKYYLIHICLLAYL